MFEKGLIIFNNRYTQHGFQPIPQGQYFGQNDKKPYIQGMSLATPKPIRAI